jgi:putative addiction module CopG family antidote
MTTINISLPDKLKEQADLLITSGYYASFSDLTRSALRKLLEEAELAILAKKAKDEARSGSSKTLNSRLAIDTYLDSLSS